VTITEKWSKRATCRVDNKNASALNQDRTQQVDPEKYCKPSGEDPSSKFLTAIVIAFVQFEVSDMQ